MDSITAFGSKSVLLSTKIRPPKARRQLLSRPRLLSLLEESQHYRLVLISAPTGYGKTTLLTDFARSQNMALCWYTLDENDRDVAVFCRYLLHSIRQVYPAFGKSFEELLGYNLDQLHQEVIVHRLSEEFVANLEQLYETSLSENYRETLLVMDDLQFAESFGVIGFLKHLVSCLPDTFHLILSSRKRPEDLPLIKLTAKQLLLGIGQDELAFTVEEVGQLLKEYYNLEEPELTETLVSFSEGWITGIVLGLGNQSLFKSGKWQEIRAAGANNSVKSQSFDTTGIFNYLAQEVLQNQPPEIQNFLLMTSVFEVMKPGQCDTLLGSFKKVEGEKVSSSSISEAILQQLESRNLFITQLGSELTEDTSYQYHALFRQFLLSTLKKKSGEYELIQLKAAEIFKNEGALLTSIQHYLEAGATERAGWVLSEIAEQLLQSGRNELLFNLLGKIPLETQKTLPQLLNVQAQLLLENGDNENSLQAYQLATTLFQKEGLIDQAARARANQAQLLARMGKRQEATGLCAVLLQDYSTLTQTNVGQQAIALAKTMLGSMATDEGNSSEAERNLVEAREIYSSTRDEFHLAMVNSYFGRLYHYEGRLVKSNVFYERALSFFVKSGNRLREAYSRLGLAGNLYLQVQYQLAEKQLNEILALSGDWKDRYLYLYVLNYIGNVYRETERYDKAQASYAKAIEIAKELKVRGMGIFVDQRIGNQLYSPRRKADSIRITYAKSRISRGLQTARKNWFELF